MKYALVAASVASLAGFVALAACSDDSNANDSASSSGGGPSGTSGSSGGSATVSLSVCKQRCGVKLDECGAPPPQRETGCTQLCGPGVTESQLVCLEGKDCESLEGAESAETICPKGSSSGGTSSGTSGNTSGGLPTSLTITGKFGTGRDATHTKVDTKIVSLVAVQADNPTISPETSTLPNLADKSIKVAVDSPDVGECAAKFTFTLNAGQVSLNVEGTDDGAANDCANFTDDITENGFKATLSNVPYPGGGTKTTVKLDLEP